jgi:hypothetical protein
LALPGKQNTNRLEVDGEIGQPSRVGGTEYRPVVCISDKQIQPLVGHQTLHSLPTLVKFGGWDGRLGVCWDHFPSSRGAHTWKACTGPLTREARDSETL